MVRTYWLGLRPSQLPEGEIHWPLIEIEPLPITEEMKEAWEWASDAIWTSRTAVRLWSQVCPGLGPQAHWAVGEGTAALLQQLHWPVAGVASVMTAEGLRDLLKDRWTGKERIVWYHAAGSRDILMEEWEASHRNVRHFPIYETVICKGAKLPPIEMGDTLVFTSPSCVKAWGQLRESAEVSKRVTVRCIGPITQQAWEMAKVTL